MVPEGKKGLVIFVLTPPTACLQSVPVELKPTSITFRKAGTFPVATKTVFFKVSSPSPSPLSTMPLAFILMVPEIRYLPAFNNKAPLIPFWSNGRVAISSNAF